VKFWEAGVLVCETEGVRVLLEAVEPAAIDGRLPRLLARRKIVTERVGDR
jgi:hypothetical protein